MTRYGRIGVDGQTTVKNEAKAQKLHKLVVACAIANGPSCSSVRAASSAATA